MTWKPTRYWVAGGGITEERKSEADVNTDSPAWVTRRMTLLWKEAKSGDVVGCEYFQVLGTHTGIFIMHLDSARLLGDVKQVPFNFPTKWNLYTTTHQ